MKLDFLNTVPYVCERWTALAQQEPAAGFLTEEGSGTGFTRRQVDELSARVYSYLDSKRIGAEDFVLIRLPRDARPFIAMLGVWKAGAAFTAVEDTYAPERMWKIRMPLNGLKPSGRTAGAGWLLMKRHGRTF